MNHNDSNFSHTREEVMRLVGDAFDIWHCRADDLYIAVQRIVDARIAESRKKAFHQEQILDGPNEIKGDNDS
jgi:hypothetical protein